MAKSLKTLEGTIRGINLQHPWERVLNMASFDQIWVANRFRYRKTLTGSRLRYDDVTGYMEPSDRRGFSAEMRKTFIDRFRVCCNMKQISQSVNVDIQTVYDAIAVDSKFRADYIECNKNTQRTKQLNNEMMKLAASEKLQVIIDLKNKIKLYQ